MLVACLCADWCQVCNDWRPVFDALALELADQAQFVWVDIEDDEELLGGLEVDDFPTLLIAHHDRVDFFGVVQGSDHSVRRLLQRARDGGLGPALDRRLEGLPERLRAGR